MDSHAIVSRRIALWGGGVVLALSLGGAGPAQTARVTVLATDVIYAAGTQASVASGASGTAPAGVISLPSDAQGIYFPRVIGSLRCPFASGCISLNSGEGEGNNLNDPDGNAAQVATSSVRGAGSISGVVGPGAGYLVGVFIAAGGPSGPRPRALNFTQGLGISRRSGAPALNQVFFIGDGLTGDGTGLRQGVRIPTGASSLVLGISDACGYIGTASCYADNDGSYTVDYKFLPVLQ